ncbi:uncharacterized protein K02A2.6-like isoform X1 [Pectinophora gossypiella]|uniref:uncharacterized protein K02A2.6-like isoform X1 n=1 Tax=Pectinophora gossypiella TaxID=13191 RepID=UPI00214E94EB|nr:uncharacterized protein K02A2.6-like isoform X1 [Pectinophora gossypiella]
MAYVGLLPIFDYKTCEWALFKGRLTQYLKVNNVNEENKCAILITHLSDDSYRLVRNLAYPDSVDEYTYKKLVLLLDNHFKPKKCTYADRAKFYGASRHPGENLGDWAARLRGLASYCEFGSALDTVLTDRFILGLGPGPERDKLFEQGPSILKIGQALEMAEQAASAREAKTMVLPKLDYKEEPIYRASMGTGGGRGLSAGQAGGGTHAPLRDQRTATGEGSRCAVCGLKNHSSKNCRYKNYKCQNCGVKGHLKKVCGNKNSRVNNITCDEQSESENEVLCCQECQNFNLRYVTNKPLELNLVLGKRDITMELDSGSGTSVISEQMYRELFSDYKLQYCNIRMCLYNGHKISPEGYFNIEATFNKQSKRLKIFVVKNGGPPLLGRDFMSAFNLVLTTKINSISDVHDTIDTLLEQYSELWSDELGTFNSFKIKLQLKEDAYPKFYKPRNVPFALKDKVTAELDRLVGLGILVPVNHSDYATPIVPVLKENGKVRIAGDYSITLNKDLVIDKYPLPRIEEVFAKLGGGKYFTKIDLKNAYNQFVLDDSSQDLTTINTMKGLFKYTRLVYGLANAPAIFQRSMETILAGLEGVSCWLDDICITGPDDVTHMSRLREVLRRLSGAGLRLRKEKCEFFKKSVTYLGYVIDEAGLHTCPDKVRAIIDAPEPTNVTEIKRFVGVVNYYRNFIPNASVIMSPLYDLLRADVNWEWGERQRSAVAAVKRELSSERVLTHFTPGAQLVLEVDAGPAGLGAVLSQQAPDGILRPLAFASRSLTASERNYSQIHKEATAVIFGVKRFHQYLFGVQTPFILKTDHRPLLTIFGKKNGISVTAALRLQRYAIILSAYNYTVQYITSKNNVIADYFSRAPLPSMDNESERDSGHSFLFLDANIKPVSYDDIKQATASDKVLCTVIKYMSHGWPRKISCASIKSYYHCKLDLEFHEGCLFRGHRVVIPEIFRERMLEELHSAHFGIVKTKSAARGRMWWPGIDGDIERWVASCGACAALRAAPPRASPAPWPRPPRAWFTN